MTPEMVIDLFQQTILTVLIMLTVIILPGLLIGLIVSIFQAATQINEQTLSFVPRLFVTFLALVFSGPWLLNKLLAFFELILTNIGAYIV